MNDHKKTAESVQSSPVPPQPPETPQKDHNGDYYVIDFYDGQLKREWLTRTQRDKLKPEDRDAHFDLCNGVWRIQTESGGVVGPPDQFPLGATHWDRLQEVLLKAPDFVYLPSQNYIYAQIARLQKAFGKPSNKDSDYWLQTERKPVYRVRLNPDRTLRIVVNSNLGGLLPQLGPRVLKMKPLNPDQREYHRASR